MSARDREDANADPPLAGTVVLDAARMLPAAILDRLLLDLGARVIKVERPGGGDPMRHLPPLVGRMGAAFSALLAGAESITLELREQSGADALRRLSRRVDILLESFRPGVLAGWGLDLGDLRAGNERLITCSLPGIGGGGPELPVHDLNLAAVTGALNLIGDGVPGIQLADVGAALLAATAVVAALVRRGRDGRGSHIQQPLLSGPGPFTAWARAEATAGGGGIATTVMRGSSPAYNRYRCADGSEVVVAALEPKFWVKLLDVLGLPELTTAAIGDRGEAETAFARLAAAFAGEPRSHWLDLAEREGLPITAVETIGGLAASAGVGSFIPSLGDRCDLPPPALGEHTDAVLSELAVDR